MSVYLKDHPNPNLRQYRSPRRERVSGVFVVHSAENTPDFVAFDGGAEAVASFISRRTDPGSYHFLADSDSVLHLVEWGDEAWHDATSGGNRHEVGGSIATRADAWELAPKAWRDGAIDNLARGFAAAARYVLAETGIVVPARLITRAESEARVPGFLSHAKRDPKRRSDPGFDTRPDLWDQFLARYRHHAADVLGTTPAPTTGDPTMAQIDDLYDRLSKIEATQAAQARQVDAIHRETVQSITPAPGRKASLRWLVGDLHSRQAVSRGVIVTLARGVAELLARPAPDLSRRLIAAADQAEAPGEAG